MQTPVEKIIAEYDRRIKGIEKIPYWGHSKELVAERTILSVSRDFARSLLAEEKEGYEKWIKIEDELPTNIKEVWGTDGKHCYPVRYTKGYEIEFEDFDDDGEYDEIEEKRGCRYLKSGWYELEEQRSGDYDECYMPRKVTHWQPLPKLPTQPNKQ